MFDDFAARPKSGMDPERVRVSLDQAMQSLRELTFRFADHFGVEDMRTLMLIRIHEGALDVCDAVEALSSTKAGGGLAFGLIDYLEYVCNYATEESDWMPRMAHYVSTFALIRARFRFKKFAKEFRYRTRSFFRSVALILETVFPPGCPPPGEIPGKKPMPIEKRIFCPGFQPFDESSRTMRTVRDHLARRNGESPPPEPKAPSLDVFDDVL